MKSSAFTLWFSRLLSSLNLYLPVVAMLLLALGSWWLARNTPGFATPEPEKTKRHEPDYFLHNFSVKNFDANGDLVSEVMGAKARHFPDSDVLEIEQARMRASKEGRITTGQGRRAYSNGDGSEVQLVGDAVVVREAGKDAQGKESPRVEFRGEFLHAFMNTQQIKSHKPVNMLRGNDRFSGERMQYDHLDGIVQLDGRVRVILESRQQP